MHRSIDVEDLSEEEVKVSIAQEVEKQHKGRQRNKKKKKTRWCKRQTFFPGSKIWNEKLASNSEAHHQGGESCCETYP